MFNENEYNKEEIDCSKLLGITLNKYRDLVNINNLNHILEQEEKYISNYKKNVSVGDIWICNIPILVYDSGNNINVYLQKRPILILDNGSGKIVKKDKKNYYALKITSQEDNFMRKYIENWSDLGLNYRSYIRIELPIKVEKEQLENKLSTIDKEQLNQVYKEIYKLLNLENIK